MVRSTDRSAIAVAFALILASFTLRPLTQDISYVSLSVVLILVLMLVAAVMRRLRLNNGLILGLQVLVLLVFVSSVVLSLGGSGGFFEQLVALFQSAAEHMRTQAAPMPPQAGVKLLLVAAVGVVTILTDVLVVSIDRPAWALAPPLTLYLVPALGLRGDLTWWPFALLAVGYLTILLDEGIGLAERWPQGVSADSNKQGWVGPFAARTALLIGVPVIALTLLVGAVVPLPGQPGWGLSKARGENGPLQLADPTLDLRRNLTQPDDVTVMTYRTDRPTGAYLRMASLPVVTSSGWFNSSMNLRDDRRLSPVPGSDVDEGKPRRTEIAIGDFRSEYIPMPYAPRQFEAEGEFAFDPTSLIVIGTGENRAQATRNLTYTVDSIDIEPNGSRLSGAEAGVPADANLTAALPADIPTEIIDLTIKITKDAPTPALKAAAIQEFLRSNEFTYSTDPQPGTGFDALQRFLLVDKKGYCEQFAGAMALMSRIVGIPTRVSVGFLPGERTGDNWEVTIRDMHAWPELYFAEDGWVRFEPTPATRTGTAPSWTVVRTESDSAGPSSAQPSGASEEPSSAPGDSATPTASPSPEAQGDESGFPRERVLLGIGITLVLVALASIPGLLRRRRRRERLEATPDATSQVENAWAEIRARIIDYGEAWPVGSPRQIGADLADRLEPAASKAVGTLAAEIERARFSASYLGADTITTLASDVLAGLDQGRSWDQRLIANWWPKSFWSELGRKLPWSSR